MDTTTLQILNTLCKNLSEKLDECNAEIKANLETADQPKMEAILKKIDLN